jgi:hypothetical protein
VEAGEQTAAGNVPNLQFSIELLQVIKSAQQQNGLKHGDYGRYRLGYYTAAYSCSRACASHTFHHLTQAILCTAASLAVPVP